MGSNVCILKLQKERKERKEERDIVACRVWDVTCRIRKWESSWEFKKLTAPAF